MAGKPTESFWLDDAPWSSQWDIDAVTISVHSEMQLAAQDAKDTRILIQYRLKHASQNVSSDLAT